MFFQGNEKYNCATYLRLSRSDGDQQESNSIKNQRALLNDYMGKHPELHKFDEYVDDGYSGTNFERPDFKRMMQDIEKRNVNCIIVKDLSRFGRNYIETGRYLERIFPFMGVRFIAINDHYDSAEENDDKGRILIPFNNLINDTYCRDISLRVRSHLDGCYMKERGKLLTNTVVTTVMSNFGLYKAFDEQGIGYAKTAVGDKYVYEYMAKNGCRIGGEQSGHIIFSKYASTGDGILTSLKMMEVMLAKKKPMSELAAALKIYPQVLENVRVTDKKAAQSDEAVQTAVKKVAEGLGDTGRILVRESGTEPVVRVMVEAPDHDTCQKYVSEVVDVIRDRGYSL